MQRSGRPKNQRNKGRISEPLLLGKICNKYAKHASKCLQKEDSETGVAPLGAVLGHVWYPKTFVEATNEPIAFPKCPQGSKLTQKMTPEVEKLLEKCSKKGQHSVLFLDVFGKNMKGTVENFDDLKPGPADCAKRFE